MENQKAPPLRLHRQLVRSLGFYVSRFLNPVACRNFRGTVVHDPTDSVVDHRNRIVSSLLVF